MHSRIADRIRHRGHEVPRECPRARGQSIAEFAVILPLLLALVGAVLDFARLFQAYNTLESATRNAAEYTATKSGSTTYLADAATIICRETVGLPGYVTSVSATGGCTQPRIEAAPSTSFTVSTTDPGASAAYPIVTIKLSTALAFRTLFPYPLLTRNGVWTLRSTQQFKTVQGR